MRKKGNVFILSDRRDRDLLRAYNEQVGRQLRLYGRVVQTGLMERVVASPASRYWVSSERACVVIGKMERGESIAYMNPAKRRFYNALYNAFLTYRKEHPEVQARKHVVEMVVMQPAPCFSVTPRVARNIIQRVRRKCQREKIERLRSK